MSVLNSRCVAPNKAGTFLDISLGKFFRFSEFFQTFANNHYASLQTLISDTDAN